MNIHRAQCIQQLLIFFLLYLPSIPLWAEVSLQNTGVGKEISTIIATEQNPYLTRSNFPHRAEELAALYGLLNNQLLWLGNPQSEKNISEALNLLANASLQGLNPEDYDASTLRQKLPAALQFSPDAYLQLALYDTALSLAVLRFAHDVHYGSIDPKTLNFNLKHRPKKLLDLPALIKNAVMSGTLAQLPSHVEPQVRQYAKLKQALATYIELAKTTPVIKFFIKKSIRPGSEYPQLPELQRFLLAVGDLSEEKTIVTEPTSLRYTDKLAEGVKKFQRRHGLTPTGILDKDTANAINVPLDQRATQIKLAMERLRWLPEFAPGQAVIVNIPAFQLWAFDDITAEQPNITHINVVVGKSLKNQTPSLMADMRLINFQPYWNVPSTILKEEILPKLINGKQFLAKQNMEIVSNYGGSEKPIPLNTAALDKLKKGIFRVRQRPGKGNALGKIKFIFPNKADVYLHDTPAKALFKKTRRDFSHGCVRVEEPEKLAEFVFKNQKGWDKEKIRKALKNPTMQEIVLSKPIPVLLFYSTAFFNEDDDLMFYPDIYDRDPPLLAALSKHEDLSDLAIFIPPKELKTPPPATTTNITESIDPRPAELMQ